MVSSRLARLGRTGWVYNLRVTNESKCVSIGVLVKKILTWIDLQFEKLK